jgi:hypothetical protein
MILISFIKRKIDEVLNPKHCGYCGTLKEPHGYYDQMDCPNRCAWKIFEEKYPDYYSNYGK